MSRLTARVAIVRTSHWHADYIVQALRTLPGIAVVGVSDPDADAARRAAEPLGARVYADDRSLLDGERLDFVFAFGQPFEMAQIGRQLVERRIPFSIEKPAGQTAADVDDLLQAASSAGVFVSVPFVFRLAAWADQIRTARAGEPAGPLAHASFRLIAPLDERYVESRRGCATHVSAHFVDLFAFLAGCPVRRVFANVGDRVHRRAIEDHAVMLLEAEDGSTCTIETGYTLPTGGPLDLSCVVRTADSYVQVGPGWVNWTGSDGRETRHSVPTRSRDFYQAYVADVLRRAHDGASPLVGLAEMRETLRVVEAAYRSHAERTPIELPPTARSS